MCFLDHLENRFQSNAIWEFRISVTMSRHQCGFSISAQFFGQSGNMPYTPLRKAGSPVRPQPLSFLRGGHFRYLENWRAKMQKINRED
jgi:hypothetical protein